MAAGASIHTMYQKTLVVIEVSYFPMEILPYPVHYSKSVIGVCSDYISMLSSNLITVILRKQLHIIRIKGLISIARHSYCINDHIALTEVCALGVLLYHDHYRCHINYDFHDHHYTYILDFITPFYEKGIKSEPRFLSSQLTQTPRGLPLERANFRLSWSLVIRITYRSVWLDALKSCCNRKVAKCARNPLPRREFESVQFSGALLFGLTLRGLRSRTLLVSKPIQRFRGSEERPEKNKMPTCISPTIYHLYAEEMERRARLRERENEDLENVNERLLAQIRDLRQYLHQQEELRERRLIVNYATGCRTLGMTSRWLKRRRIGLRGGVYRVITD
ncbi:uncharacterized protein [Penaeus vannamei]|uniref:uncharacterized protein n=1 Tax=Penaeus vannamei TaxID=6689 RepID=UPI00387F64CD